jgi:hypothetical protein
MIAANESTEVRYALAPWTLDASSARDMLRAAERFPDVTEEGEADRLMAAWAMLAGVPVLAHPEPGFALNTITPQDLPNARGAAWIHGVKHLAIFQALAP